MKWMLILLLISMLLPLTVFADDCRVDTPNHLNPYFPPKYEAINNSNRRLAPIVPDGDFNDSSALKRWDFIEDGVNLYYNWSSFGYDSSSGHVYGHSDLNGSVNMTRHNDSGSLGDSAVEAFGFGALVTWGDWVEFAGYTRTLANETSQVRSARIGFDFKNGSSGAFLRPCEGPDGGVNTSGTWVNSSLWGKAPRTVRTVTVWYQCGYANNFPRICWFDFMRANISEYMPVYFARNTTQNGSDVNGNKTQINFSIDWNSTDLYSLFVEVKYIDGGLGGTARNITVINKSRVASIDRTGSWPVFVSNVSNQFWLNFTNITDGNYSMKICTNNSMSNSYRTSWPYNFSVSEGSNAPVVTTYVEILHENYTDNVTFTPLAGYPVGYRGWGAVNLLENCGNFKNYIGGAGNASPRCIDSNGTDGEFGTSGGYNKHGWGCFDNADLEICISGNGALISADQRDYALEITDIDTFRWNQNLNYTFNPNTACSGGSCAEINASFRVTASGLNDTEFCIVAYKVGNSDPIILWNVTGLNTSAEGFSNDSSPDTADYVLYDVEMSSEYAVDLDNATHSLILTGFGTSNNEHCNYDEVKITGTSSALQNGTLQVRLIDDFSGAQITDLSINVNKTNFSQTKSSVSFGPQNFSLIPSVYNVTQFGTTTIAKSKVEQSTGIDPFALNLSIYGAKLNINVTSKVKRLHIMDANITYTHQNLTVANNGVFRNYVGVHNVTVYVISDWNGGGNIDDDSRINISAPNFFKETTTLMHFPETLPNNNWGYNNVSVQMNLSDSNVTFLVQDSISGASISATVSLANFTYAFGESATGINSSFYLERNVTYMLNLSAPGYASKFNAFRFTPSGSSAQYILTMESSSQSLVLSGLEGNVTAELGTSVQVESQSNGSVVCIDIPHPSYGKNYTCNTTINFPFNISYFRNDVFRDGDRNAINITWTSAGNHTFNVSANSLDEIDKVSINLTGNSTGGFYPSDVKIYVNGTLSNDIGTVGNTSFATVSTFNNSASATSINWSFPSVNASAWVRLPVNNNITSAMLRLTGISIFLNETRNVNQSVQRFTADPLVYTVGSAFSEFELLKWINKSISSEKECGDCSTYIKLNYTVMFEGKPNNVSLRLAFYSASPSGGDVDWASVDTRVYVDNGAGYLQMANHTQPLTQCNVVYLNFSPANNQWNGTHMRMQFIFQTTDSTGTPSDGGFTGTPSEACDNHTGLTGDVGILGFNITATNQAVYPRNAFMEVGIIDGTKEWNDTEPPVFDGIQNSINFSNATNTYLSSCIEDAQGYCNVPIYLGQEAKGGGIKLDNLVVQYNSILNPVVLSQSAIQRFINRSHGNVSVPITIYNSVPSGLKINDLRWDYAGGNKTYSVLSHTADYSSNLSFNVTFFFSDWQHRFPTGVEFIEFIPSSPRSRNVSAYGQTPSKPILNITSQNTGGLKYNYSIHLNESFSCVNLSFANNSNKGTATLLNNNSWNLFRQNVSLNQSYGIWMWADYGCNSSSLALWNPTLSLRACGEGTICSGEVRNAVS